MPGAATTEDGVFTPRDEANAGREAGGTGGPGIAAAQLSHSLILEDPSIVVIARFTSLAERYGQWR